VSQIIGEANKAELVLKFEENERKKTLKIRCIRLLKIYAPYMENRSLVNFQHSQERNCSVHYIYAF